MKAEFVLRALLVEVIEKQAAIERESAALLEAARLIDHWAMKLRWGGMDAAVIEEVESYLGLETGELL